MGWIYISCSLRCDACDLKNHRFISGYKKVVDIGGLSPEAARLQGLQLRGGEVTSEAHIEGSGDHGVSPIFWMGVRIVDEVGGIADSLDIKPWLFSATDQV